jgi:hypothetical protein
MQNTVLGIYGLKGSGKTALLALLAYLYHLQGYRVITNVQFHFPCEILDPKDLVELSPNLQDAVIALAELHNLFDSRKSGSVQNTDGANFILQSRHRNCDVIYDDQFQGQFDKRIRDNTDLKVIAENLYADTDGDGYDDLFRYTCLDIRRQRQLPAIELYMKPVFELYDTDEIVDVFRYQREKHLNTPPHHDQKDINNHATYKRVRKNNATSRRPAGRRAGATRTGHSQDHEEDARQGFEEGLRTTLRPKGCTA